MVVSSAVSQRRYAHTDVKFPDYGGYKKDAKYRSVEGGREAGKVFTYMMIGGSYSVIIISYLMLAKLLKYTALITISFSYYS